jgi:hypothetical protein
LTALFLRHLPRLPSVYVHGVSAEIEARSRLESIRDVLDHERSELLLLEDPLLDDVLRLIETLRTEIDATLAHFPAR